MSTTLDRLVITVAGRPAPQGSKHLGEHGQMREASAYLPAWRAAVKRDTYKAYRAAEIKPAQLPLFVGPVVFSATFLVPLGVPVSGAPDLDKLIRSTWDGLSGARVWEDDGRVVAIDRVRERHVLGFELAGAIIEVRPDMTCDRCIDPTPATELVACQYECTHWQCERCAAWTRKETHEPDHAPGVECPPGCSGKYPICPKA